MLTTTLLLSIIGMGVAAAWQFRQRALQKLAERAAEAEEKLRQHAEALDAIEKATRAQRDADAVPSDRVLDNDGYRRD